MPDPEKINPEAKPEGEAEPATRENPQAGLQTTELPEPKGLSIEEEFPVGLVAGAGEAPAAREGDQPGQQAPQVSSETPLPAGFAGDKYKTIGDVEKALSEKDRSFTELNTRLTATEADQARRDQLVAAYFGKDGENLSESQKQRLDVEFMQRVNENPRDVLNAMIEKATEKAVQERVGPQLQTLQAQAGAQDIQNVIQAIGNESENEKSPFYGFDEGAVSNLVNNPPNQEVAESVQRAREGHITWRTLLFNLHNAVRAVQMPELVKQQAEQLANREEMHRDSAVLSSGPSVERAGPGSEAEDMLGTMGLGFDDLAKRAKDPFK